jgi:pimeloyl-ACP methyl ester carboxylesterase
MPYATLKTGIKLYFKISGKGQPVLLIPGSGGSQAIWHFQASALKNYTCITIDVRGGGKSDKPDERYTMRLMAKDVISLADQLGLQKLHFAGFSLGSAVCQEIGINHPERVGSLILLNTWAKTDRWLRDFFELMKLVLKEGNQKLSTKFRDTHLLSSSAYESPKFMGWWRWYLRELGVAPPYARLRIYDADIAHDTLGKLTRIRAPTLILGGEEDIEVPIRYQRIVHEGIRGSEFQIIRGQGSSHYMLVERHEDISRSILHFLKKSPIVFQ